ncbi:hypothetical protein [Roseibium algae]|uniref:Uncharacterized protein n=1 Tax=Roseibium algae TaxID=3123038 RepID=A0ABU8TEN1_9HYPH
MFKKSMISAIAVAVLATSSATIAATSAFATSDVQSVSEAANTPLSVTKEVLRFAGNEEANRRVEIVFG